MKEFVLLFRMDITNKEVQPTEEQMKGYMTQWMSWIDSIAKQKQLVDGGNHLSRSGKVLRPNNKIAEGPYTKDNESVAGYIIILAKNSDDAIRIASKCPILEGKGTSVEVREVEN